MKYFLLLLSLFAVNIVNAQIVFLDINNNPLEKKTAIAAAKQAGKKIIIYPEDSSKFEVSKAFEILSQNPPETLFISGHDGGGSFGGDRGESFEYQDLNALVKAHPEIGENLRVLGLLGCNTANHKEISKWKSTFPNLAFVAGYDGTAPSGSKPAGHAYLRDTILKSDRILREADEKKIKALFQSFQYISYLEATLYVDTCPGDDSVEGQYIFRPLRPSAERFKKFDTAECASKRSYFEKFLLPAYGDYFFGVKEIPRQTHGTQMREIYTFMRQNEHCFEAFEGSEYPHGDHLLFLLFYHNVKENFITYFEDELKHYFDFLSIRKDEKTLISFLEQKKIETQIELDRLETYSKDFASYKKDYMEHNKKELETLKRDYQSYYLLQKKFEANPNNPTIRAQFIQLEKNPQWNYFQSKFLQLNKAINLIDEELKRKLFIMSEIAKSNIEEINSILDDPDKIKENIMQFQALPAKNLEDFKRLSKKDVADFAFKQAYLDNSYLGQPDFAYAMSDAINRILFNVDAETIPFNWHDADIRPADPTLFNNITLRTIIRREQSLEGRLFE